jgi:hypothetical protein
MRKTIAMLAAGTLLLALAACGGDDASEGGTGDTGSSGAEIAVTDAWARSAMEDKAAVYFVVTNDGETDDRLVGAAADVDAMVGIHETTMSDGVAEMQPVDGVDVPAGETVTFEPGGYHVMLEELTAPLEVGSTIGVTLTFEQAGEITVEAEVREFVEEDSGGGM